MIAGIFHQGSGIGNQLFRYVAIRCLALDKGYDFGMVSPELFKGHSLFPYIDMGKKLDWLQKWEEKKVTENGVDIRGYDPEINFVKDFTILDGEFQDERYFKKHLYTFEDPIREWLKVEPLLVPDDICVINFRGGEYKTNPDLFLPKEYWNEAIQMMKDKYPNIDFEVHTDDLETAKEFFPNFHINVGMDYNWRAIRHAKHLILSNSSFAILPALLNEFAREIIAPRGWARHNLKDGTWSMNQNYYSKFTYI